VIAADVPGGSRPWVDLDVHKAGLLLLARSRDQRM
jgi:hypothetical protein